MKITVLGSSHGVPERDRFCTSIMVEAGGKRYLVDGGAPVASLLIQRGMTPCDIEAVFVTHTHGDHINGLLEMIDLESWFFTKAHTRFLFPEENAVAAIKGYLAATHGGKPPREVELDAYTEGPIWDDGNIRVTAIRNRHMTEPRRTCSFLVEAEGKKVLFTGDMSGTFADFPSQVGKVDLVLCEAAHCRLENAREYLSRAQTPKMVFHHIAPVNAELRKQDLPFETEYAWDGSEYWV